MVKAKSKAQARLFGAVAGGKETKAKGLPPSEAKKRLEGVKVSDLPKKAKARKKGKR